jgi:hypothetical protein
VPEQSSDSESGSENDHNDSDLSTEEDGEDVEEISGAAKSNVHPNRTRTDNDAGNTVLNGLCPLLLIYSHG